MSIGYNAYMRRLFHFAVVRFLVATVVIIGVMSRTNPDTIGPAGITAFFLLIYYWSFEGLRLLLRFVEKTFSSMPFTAHDFFPVALVAGLPSVFLALQSINQLTLRDSLIIVVAVMVMIFYWRRRFKSPR